MRSLPLAGIVPLLATFLSLAEQLAVDGNDEHRAEAVV